MAKEASVRWESPADLEVIDKYESVFKSSQQASDRLFVILFNEEVPEAGGIETRFEKWQQHYETTHKVRFYKCVINDYEKDMKTQFKIKDTPTLVFIRNGIEIDRIENLNESNPNIVNQADINKESEDEKRVRKKLDELCKRSG